VGLSKGKKAHFVGTKFYKLNHHLGNVRATVSDLRTGGNGLVKSAGAYLGKNLVS